MLEISVGDVSDGDVSPSAGGVARGGRTGAV